MERNRSKVNDSTIPAVSRSANSLCLSSGLRMQDLCLGVELDHRMALCLRVSLCPSVLADDEDGMILWAREQFGGWKSNKITLFRTHPLSF